MPDRFKNPEYLLILLAAAGAFAFSVWHTLINNFAVEKLAFSGAEIGILQSLREIPGVLAFTTIFILLLLRELSINSYFHKIADPKDIASTAGISFTINHIAAVIIPVLLGILWLASPAAVFLCGTAMAVVSLGFSRFVPISPEIQRFALPLKSALRRS